MTAVERRVQLKPGHTLLLRQKVGGYMPDLWVCLEKTAWEVYTVNRDGTKTLVANVEPPQARAYCRNGHPLVASNRFVNSKKQVACRTCRSEVMNRYRTKKANAPMRVAPVPEFTSPNGKTHCKHGHFLSGENIYMNLGVVECRQCRRDAAHRSYLRRKERIKAMEYPDVAIPWEEDDDLVEGEYSDPSLNF